MLKVVSIVCLFAFVFAQGVSASEPDPETLDEAIDRLVAEGTPYVILISHGGNGGYELIIVTTTPFGLVTSEAGYNELGVSGGVIYGGTGMLIQDYIDHYGLSIDDSCQYDPTCLGGTSSTNGSS